MPTDSTTIPTCGAPMGERDEEGDIPDPVGFCELPAGHDGDCSEETPDD